MKVGTTIRKQYARARRVGDQVVRLLTPRTTRDCLDPWINLEITASGGLKPCCNIPALQTMDGTPESAFRAMSSSLFREVRRGLLTGDLGPHCETCHDRKRIPQSRLRERVATLQRSRNIADPVDSSFPDELRIDINELCNLRCDYCAVTHPDYRGQKMRRDMFPAMHELAMRMPQGSRISINGHGETTFHPHWTEIALKIVDLGHRPEIITNLAKSFSDAEIDLLARFSRITVSLDGLDAKMMREIRRAVSVDHVFSTIERIVASAENQETSSPPLIGFSVGVYDPSIWELEAFMEKLVEVGVGFVYFWTLLEYPHQTKVRSVAAFDECETASARRIMGRVKSRLESAGIKFIIQDNFVDASGRPMV